MEDQRILLAFEDAIATRGKRKGMLKAKCPPMGTDGALMWQACMMNANPYKVGMGHLILMNKECRDFFMVCQAWADERASVLRHLDRDRVALEDLGVW